MTAILLVNGSYRAGGVTDQVAEIMAEALQNAGADVETVFFAGYSHRILQKLPGLHNAARGAPRPLRPAGWDEPVN